MSDHPEEKDDFFEEGEDTGDGDDQEYERKPRALVFTARHTAIRCASCNDPILLGPVVCPACIEAGFCAVCGLGHHAWQCPDVARVRLEMAAAERAVQRGIVRDWAADLRARYEAEPVAC